MKSGPKHQLASLEAGRFVAALLVALFHIESAIHKFYGRFVLDDVFRSGHAGVEYFFVLSGFIIFWVHKDDIGHPDRGAQFLEKRAIRILPMYWFAFVCLVVGYYFFPSFLQGRNWSASEYISDFFLFPRSGEMVLSVAWTLRLEIVFYLFFFLSIIVPRIGFGLIVAWQLSIFICMISGYHSDYAITQAVLSTYNLGFGAGILAAYCALSRPARHPVRFIAAGFFGFIAVMIADWRLGQDLPHATLSLGQVIGSLLYGSMAAILVFGLASFETKRPFVKNRIITTLGGSSYVLYLFHGMVSSLMARLIRVYLGPNLSPEVVFVILIAAVVAAGILLHVTFEKSILRLLRRKAQLRAARSPNVAYNSNIIPPKDFRTSSTDLSIPQ